MTTGQDENQNSSEMLLAEWVVRGLQKAGWPSEGILLGPSVSVQGRTHEPDFVLLHQLYPIALLETASFNHDLQPILEYARATADSLGIPFAFVCHGTTVRPVQTRSLELPADGFPHPDQLVAALAQEWGATDLRLFPVPSGRVEIEQALAVTRLMETVQTGETHLTVQLGSSNDKAEVGFASAVKLLGSQSRHRLLYISPNEVSGLQTRTRLQAALPTTDVKYLQQFNRRVNVAAGWVATVVPNSRDLAAQLDPALLQRLAYDLVIVEDATSARLVDALSEGLPQATLIVLTGQTNPYTFGRVVFSYGLTEQLAAETLRPPVGYVRRPLKELAEIRRGLDDVGNRPAKDQTAESAALIGGRDIGPDGQVDYAKLERVELQPGELERYRLIPGDVLVASWVPADGPVKLTQIPANRPEKLVFANRLSRLRIDPKQIEPNQVYQFLRSDSGQTILKQFAGKTRMALQDLAEVPIFIPDPARLTQPMPTSDPVTAPPDDNGAVTTTPLLPQAVVFSDAANTRREIEDTVLNLLNQAITEETTGQTDQATQRLQEVAQRLQRIVGVISKKPLGQLVLDDYPTPIALAYRRFLEARFNPYEQVSRLRDVYEAASFFIYNVVLADRCQRLDPETFRVDKGDGKGAYKNSAIAARLQFINKVCDLARTPGAQKLFLVELPDSDFSARADKLRELRNKLSHTATQTESQVKNILAENKPLLDQLLSVLSFLTDYRLVRVSGFYFDGDKLKRQQELYRGTAPLLDEDELQSEEMSRVRAHREHLVLFDQDDNMLDLHPLYQLVAHEKTRHVTHLCFLKSVGGQQLNVESVQEGFDFDITQGMSDLNKLVSTL